ncbi:hypothetical protein C5B85_13570 [Pseudoclavibacter sp. AY1F1]|uniref:TetR/AcrR family transcriptional regulator n=1 Tax=Pseudoclavibacter sp. AY1F1 TaxID=2080583 RepID=UPI000CE919DB|nr:TetR family transcriptional regulator [Pseudoclavibacter sp. AY1F1]PPF43349.1 hypothetical protein C5B85_13570 [Pseudoclavibacter sp. AY1F1]
MGRPSLVHERRPQIVEAAKRVIGKYGVEGATQERIASEAQLSRAHIRHYVGNRDELIQLVWNSTMEPYAQEMHERVQAAHTGLGLAGVLDFLFGTGVEASPDDAVFDAFLAWSQHDERVRERLLDSYETVVTEVATAIRATYPKMDVAESEALGYAMLCLTIGSSSMSVLQFPAKQTGRLRDVAASMIHAAATA